MSMPYCRLQKQSLMPEGRSSKEERVHYFEGEKTVKVNLEAYFARHGIQSLCCGTQHQSF